MEVFQARLLCLACERGVSVVVLLNSLLCFQVKLIFCIKNVYAYPHKRNQKLRIGDVVKLRTNPKQKAKQTQLLQKMYSTWTAIDSEVNGGLNIDKAKQARNPSRNILRSIYPTLQILHPNTHKNHETSSLAAKLNHFQALRMDFGDVRSRTLRDPPSSCPPGTLVKISPRHGWCGGRG